MGKEKKVSLWSSILFTICSVLVLDTFVAPTIIGTSSITIWIITTIIFFIPYGLLSAELGSTYPDDGGMYIWIKKAFGNFWAVLNGWFYWVNVAFWMPAVFVAFSSWFAYAFFPAMLETDPTMSNVIMATLAILMCWLVVYIGIRGVELSVAVTNIAGVLKVAVLLVFGFLGVAYMLRFGSANSFSPEQFIPTFDNTTQYIAAILYNLLGFELIGSIGSKIENPEKTIPKMTMVAGVIIAGLYIFGTFGVLVALPAEMINEADGFYLALEELCRVFGPAQMPVFYVVIVVAMLTLVSNMVSWTLGANEIMVASKIDQRVKILSGRSKKYGTPAALYIVMGVVSTVLVAFNFMLSGDANEVFWVIFSFSLIIFMIPYLFMFPAVAILRKIDPDTERVYKIPGGKFGLYLTVILTEGCILMSLFFMFKEADGLALSTFVIGTIITTLVGVWIYFKGRDLDTE